MMSRRGAVLTVGSLLGRREGIAKASQPRTMVDFAVPKGACDCHTHIFGDTKNFPLWAGRAYTPPSALPREMSALHKTLRVDRVVIVTPSVYGTDNAATVYGLKARRGTSRGIAVIDDRTTDAELKSMGALGMCGVRLNLSTGAEVGVEGARKLLTRTFDRMAGLGWHVQVYAGLNVISGVEDMVMRAPVPVVVDHVAGALPAAGVGQPGFGALLRLLKAGRAYVKVTDRFMPSGTAPSFEDSRVMVKALIAANAERVLWGTDWPHPDSSKHPGRKATDVSPFEDVDDGLWLNRFAKWGGDARMLVDNPARLYGF
jgi:predicted TIM-barrel fold metal-dependent hydrolase